MIQKFKNNLYQHISQLDQCVNIKQIEQICLQYLHTTGVELFKYSWQPPITTQTDNIAFWTCSEQWIERYNQQGYGDNDPKTRYAEI